MKSITLFQWVWKTLFKNILIPLLVVGLLFNLFFFITNEWTRQQNIKLGRNAANQSLLGQALNEADIINKQLLSTAQVTDVYRKQIEKVLQHAGLDEATQRQQIHSAIQGEYHIFKNSEDGAVVYFPADTPITDELMERVNELLPLESLMEDIKAAHPLIGNVYFKSSDSLTILYPDVAALRRGSSLDQMLKDHASTKTETETEAETHSFPGSRNQLWWTSPHIDAGGRGRMITSIAPVYEGNELAGVVGIDISIESFVNDIVNLAVPWKGFGVLMDNQGKILSMPLQGNMAAECNVFIRQAKEIEKLKQGTLQASFAGKENVAAWSTLPGTGWKLILFTPTEAIAANTNEISNQAAQGGYWMTGILALCYIMLFIVFHRRLKVMTAKIVAPLIHMKQMTLDIGNGNYSHPLPSYAIQELHETATQIAEMGKKMQQTMDQMEVVRIETEAAETSLLKAKEEAELASKAKSQFLSSMSHELRTPMNAILGFAQLLEYDDDNELNAEQKENVVEILKAGQHLLALINDVLDLSRIESGVIQLEMEPIPLRALVEDCLGMIEPMAKERGIKLHHHWTADLASLEVCTDRIRFKEILLNLLSNAQKYNKAQGSIAIHYEQMDGLLKIHISDTGYGIAPDKLTRIFDSFYRIKDNPINVEGTGIGLPIAKQLIELMGGSIEVYSQPNEGSTFSIVMPINSMDGCQEKPS